MSHNGTVQCEGFHAFLSLTFLYKDVFAVLQNVFLYLKFDSLFKNVVNRFCNFDYCGSRFDFIFVLTEYCI
jgi:hypothetical protein